MDFFPSLGGVRKKNNKQRTCWIKSVIFYHPCGDDGEWGSICGTGWAHSGISNTCSTRGGYFAQLTFDPGRAIGQATLPLGWSRRSKIWTRPSFLVWGEYCTYIFPETLYWDIHNLLPKECCDSWRIHYSGSLGIGECVMKPYVTYPRSSALIETLFGTSCQLQRIFGKRMWKDVEKRFDFAQLQHPKTTWTSLWFNGSCLASAAPTAKCGFGRWFMVLSHNSWELWRLPVWAYGSTGDFNAFNTKIAEDQSLDIYGKELEVWT